MASEEYRKVLSLAEKLPPLMLLDLMDDLIKIAKERGIPEMRHITVELNGVSKEFGEALIEIEETIRRAREMWAKSQPDL